ncbi:MAG: hypothetical protein IH591_11445, partial [Bacteroidales bacterium]|nr:hypothetical protein [Bacteroidales bacterium]
MEKWTSPRKVATGHKRPQCLDSRLAIMTITIFLTCTWYSLYSQVPQGINYQALAMTSTGEPLRSVTIQVRLIILSSVAPDIIQWEEIHNPVVTNESGLFTVVLGTGIRAITSAVPTFADIDWNIPQMHLRTYITHESVEHLMGTTRLLSVPYALTAGDVSGSLSKLHVEGTSTGTDDPLFEVKNKDGKTVFAVYNEGVRIYVGEGQSKAVKGGFAIGSFDESKGMQEYFVVNSDCVRVYIDDNIDKAVKGGFAIGSFDESKAMVEEYMRVTRDSTRIYLNTNGTKASKGGFAIGSFDESKGVTTDYLVVSADSVRIYIDEDTSGKAVKGGFAIGGFDESKKVLKPLMRVTLDSTRIYVADSTKGFSVANLTAPGVSQNFMEIDKINYFIGHESGKFTKMVGDAGKFNSFVGYQSGYENIGGSKNVFLGYKSGYKNNASYNVFVGNETGLNNTNGNMNVFIGHQAGRMNNGLRNTFLGYGSGGENASGGDNLYIGALAGSMNENGSYNTFLGVGSGANHMTGSYNTYVGNRAGENNMGGSRNIFIGSNAGANEYGTERLHISSSGSFTLIYGNLKQTESRVEISGNLNVTGTVTSASDARLKNII